MENPIKMDDLGVPLFLETPICKPTLPLKEKRPTPNEWHQSISQRPKIPHLRLSTWKNPPLNDSPSNLQV